MKKSSDVAVILRLEVMKTAAAAYSGVNCRTREHLFRTHIAARASGLRLSGVV